MTRLALLANCKVPRVSSMCICKRNDHKKNTLKNGISCERLLYHSTKLVIQMLTMLSMRLDLLSMIGRYVFASNNFIHLTSSGVIVQMIAVLALPPSADCRMRVSLLSRYGIWPLKDYFEHDQTAIHCKEREAR